MTEPHPILIAMAKAIGDVYETHGQRRALRTDRPKDGTLLALARAALTALRVLTSDMVEAGCIAIEYAEITAGEPDNVPQGQPAYHWGYMWRDSATDAFTAMIDAALGEEG